MRFFLKIFSKVFKKHECEHFVPHPVIACVACTECGSLEFTVGKTHYGSKTS
jgi:hypothetical protein